MGSKSRIAKYLKPVIESYINEETTFYIEAFVGGANMIDKINHDYKIGFDNNEYLIALLNKVQSDPGALPDVITYEEYKAVKDNKERYKEWYVGLVGFCGSFGAKFFNGYARNAKGDNSGIRTKQAINNLLKQAPNLVGIKFVHEDYINLDPEHIRDSVVYCDPPYRNTTKYATSRDFCYDQFYDWVREMSVNNTVLVSEYNMPDDFECIWEKEHYVSIDAERTTSDKRTEKLFKLKEV